MIGCGRLAGERIFGKYNMDRPRAMVLPNAVQTERFAFDSEVRQEVRRELGVENRFVVGMVGRLTDQKNYPFALQIMVKLRHILPDAVLVAAGNGPDEEMIRDMITKMGLEDHVMMLGRRGDVDRLYQAFDLFLMPSLYEGFPVAAVEALSSGLPVLLSDEITGELKFASGVRYLSLQETDPWVQAIRQWKETDTLAQRRIRQKEPKDNCLDIHDTAKLLEQVYAEDTVKKE